jgi:hypothetical protein
VPAVHERRLLDRTAAAAYLGCSVAQLDVLRSMGELRPVAMPGRTGAAIRVPLYDRADLDRAIERWKATE